jgi:hypothetical protein
MVIIEQIAQAFFFQTFDGITGFVDVVYLD